MGRKTGVSRHGRAFFHLFFCALLGLAVTTAAHAADERGPVTNLPLPRFVSLKADEGNVRRGPSLSHRIDWVFTRRNMPLEVTAEFGHWRRVRDREGAGGWVHYSLLSGVRTALVEDDMAALRMRPDDEAPISARAEAGVVARLSECSAEWCWVIAGGERGWVRKTALWGVKREEILE
ncbi:aspartyl-trna synthetase [Oceanicola sp. D3]|uniref:SH3 domain-containing protein n=1 Tax=Oceanicola sp. D3 TaxID=2587163 RepID=UPI00111F0855|nr:SH3 domain-containing protein [Oceanicola sp. D3]QDC11524.1 aspartyl-trna synthetase [Oceanicola sp. D3]